MTAISALLVAIVAVDCLSEPSVEERVAQRIVVTKFDPSTDFTSFTTFAMPDSVPVLPSIPATDAAVETAAPEVAEPTLREIAAQLTSRGYVEVARTESPDIGVAVTAVNRLRAGSVSYGGWWGNGSASPVFWGFSSSTLDAPFNYETGAWQSGTLIMELDDLRRARALTVTSRPLSDSAVSPRSETPPSGTVVVVWGGIVHGVIGPAEATLQAPPIESIQQAFAQSPYLHR